MFGNNNPTVFNRPSPHAPQYGRFHPHHNSGAQGHYGSQPNHPPIYGNFYGFQQNRYQPNGSHPCRYPSCGEQQPIYEPRGRQPNWPQQMGYPPTISHPETFHNQSLQNSYHSDVNEPFHRGRAPHPNVNNSAAHGGATLFRRNTASRENNRRPHGSCYGLYTSFVDQQAPILCPVQVSNLEEMNQAASSMHDFIDLTGDDEQNSQVVGGSSFGETIEQQNCQNMLRLPIVQCIDNNISDVQIEDSNLYGDAQMDIDENVSDLQIHNTERAIHLEQGLDKDSEFSVTSLNRAPRESVLCYGNERVYVSVIKVNPSRFPKNECCNNSVGRDTNILEERNHLSCQKIVYIDCNNNSGEEPLSVVNYHSLGKRQSVITMPLQGSFHVKSIFKTSQISSIFCMSEISDLRNSKRDSSVSIFSPYVYHVPRDLHFFTFSLHTHSFSFGTNVGSHEINICTVGNLLCVLAKCNGTSIAKKIFSSLVNKIRNTFLLHEKLLSNKINYLLPKLKLKNHMAELFKTNVSSRRGNEKSFVSINSEVHGLKNVCEGGMLPIHSDVGAGHNSSHVKKNCLKQQHFQNYDKTNNTSLQKSNLNLKKSALLKIFNDKCIKPAQALERGAENLHCLTNENYEVTGITSEMYLVKPTSVERAKQILKLRYVFVAEPTCGHKTLELLFTKLHVEETELLGKHKHVFEIIRLKTCPKNTSMNEQEQYRVRCVKEEQSLKLLFTKENSKDLKHITPSEMKEKTLLMEKTDNGFKYVGQESIQNVLEKLGIFRSASPQSLEQEGQSDLTADKEKIKKTSVKKTKKGSGKDVNKCYMKKAKFKLIIKRAEKVPVSCKEVCHLERIEVDQPDVIKKFISDSKPLDSDIRKRRTRLYSVENKAVATSEQVLIFKEENVQVKPISCLLDSVKTELDRSIGASTSSMIKICNNIQYIIENSRSVAVHEFLHQDVNISEAERKIIKQLCKERNSTVCDIVHAYLNVRKNFKGSLDNSSNRRKVKAILQKQFKKKKWGKNPTAKRLALLRKIMSFHHKCEETYKRETQDIYSGDKGPPNLQLAVQNDIEVSNDGEGPPVLEPEVVVSERLSKLDPDVPLISFEEELFNTCTEKDLLSAVKLKDEECSPSLNSEKDLLSAVKLKDEECSPSLNSILLGCNVIDYKENLKEDLSRHIDQYKFNLREGSNICMPKCSEAELNKKENSLVIHPETIATETLLESQFVECKNNSSEDHMSNTIPKVLSGILNENKNSLEIGTIDELQLKESLVGNCSLLECNDKQKFDFDEKTCTENKPCHRSKYSSLVAGKRRGKSMENDIEWYKKYKTVISLREYESRSRHAQPFKGHHSQYNQYSYHDSIMSPHWIPPSPRDNWTYRSRKRRNSEPYCNQRSNNSKHCSECDPRPCKACGLTFEMHINGKCDQLKVLKLQKSQKCPTYIDPACYNTLASSCITRDDVDALKKVVSEGDITLYAPEKKTVSRDPRLNTKHYQSVCTLSNLLKHSSNTDTEIPENLWRKRIHPKPPAEVSRQCWSFLNSLEDCNELLSSPEFMHLDPNHQQLPFEAKPSGGIISASQDLQTDDTLDFELVAEASSSLGVISQSERVCPVKRRRRGDEPYSPSSPTSSI